MSIEQYSLPPELLKEAENSSKGNFADLTIPDGVERTRGFAEWMEAAEIQTAYREPKPGKNGEQRTNFVVKYNIIPYGNSPNGGRNNLYDWMSINFGVLRGETAAAGNGSFDSEKGISNQNVEKIRQLAILVGYNPAEGLTGTNMDEMFPSLEEDVRGDSTLAGLKVRLRILDNAAKTSFKQKIKQYLPAPEDL